MGYLIHKLFLLKNRCSTILLWGRVIRRVFTIPKAFCPKVNVTAQLVFDPAYYDIAVQHFSNFPTGIPSNHFWKEILWISH